MMERVWMDSFDFKFKSAFRNLKSANQPAFRDRGYGPRSRPKGMFQPPLETPAILYPQLSCGEY